MGMEQRSCTRKGYLEINDIGSVRKHAILPLPNHLHHLPTHSQAVSTLC